MGEGTMSLAIRGTVRPDAEPDIESKSEPETDLGIDVWVRLSSLLSCEDVNRRAVQHRGEIMSGTRFNTGDRTQPFQIGVFTVQIIKESAYDDNIWKELGYSCGNVMEMIKLFNEDGKPKPSFSDFLKENGYTQTPHLILLETLHIYTEFRRRGVGTKVVDMIKPMFGPKSLLIVKPAFVADSVPELDQMKYNDKDEYVNGLTQMYRGMGFHGINGSGFLVK